MMMGARRQPSEISPTARPGRWKRSSSGTDILETSVQCPRPTQLLATDECSRGPTELLTHEGGSSWSSAEGASAGSFACLGGPRYVRLYRGRHDPVGRDEPPLLIEGRMIRSKPRDLLSEEILELIRKACEDSLRDETLVPKWMSTPNRLGTSARS